MSEHEVSWRKESRKVCFRLESHESSYIVYNVWILNKAFYLLTYLCVCVVFFVYVFGMSTGVFECIFLCIQTPEEDTRYLLLSVSIYYCKTGWTRGLALWAPESTLPLVLWLRQIRVCPTFYVDTLTWTLVFKLAVQAKLTMWAVPLASNHHFYVHKEERILIFFKRIKFLGWACFAW